VGRAIAVAVGLVVALGVGASAGYLGEQEMDALATPEPVSVEDETGTLAVTVPPEWDAESVIQWSPPNAEGTTFPALSVGTSAGWVSEGQGVFAGLLPGTELPERVPQHEECETALASVPGVIRGVGAAVTVVSTGCDGDGFTVERVVQISASQLLWVQVRSDSRATANQVLDTIDVMGIA